MQVREGNPTLLLKSPYALNWILDELLQGVGDPTRYKKRMFEE